MKRNIIFFDGVCNLCNSLVSLILILDKNEIFYFSSIQGETAKTWSLQNTEYINYVSKKDIVYEKSDAIIYICRDLFIIGRAFLIFKIIPKSLRDTFYDYIAKKRYSLFGKMSHCRIPSEKEKLRFLK